MLILNGNNLGERHRDLNSKVKDAKDKQTNFEEVKSQVEECDVDKLFKIDLASKYKNIDYILDVLKCGDAFYITRALKCLWLYDDDYSQFLNASFLDSNIFPFMSMKMKRKMLTIISINVRNPERAKDFYEYCKANESNQYALKFLVFTSDSFKLDLLNNETNFHGFKDSKYLKQFVGSSFDLAEVYVELRDFNNYIIHELRFMYSVSSEKYLTFLEKYATVYENTYSNNILRFGIRISRDILKKFKLRVINYPMLYINKLNKDMLVKYLTVEDIKSLGFALLPKKSVNFWDGNFYLTYKFMFAKLPANEIFTYLKQIYTAKYNDEIEMRIEFYQLKYYVMFTTFEEREAWAFRHIKRDKELPGIEDFIWYRFVSYSKAIAPIKRFAFLTPDQEKRSRILNILPETARSQEDLIEILSYYYQRHVNESERHKDSFIDTIMKHHDIYLFNTECWNLLDQLLYSLNVYSNDTFVRESYKFKAMVYYILHNKEFPDALASYADYKYFYEVDELINELSAERNAFVAKYLINRYVEKIMSLKEQLANEPILEDNSDPYCNSQSETKWEIFRLVGKIKNIIDCFKRPLDEMPDIVNEPIWPRDEYCDQHKFVPNTEGDFVRWIKQEIQSAIDGIDVIRCNTYRWNFRLTRLFRKLNVYFAGDVGIEYLKYFTDYLEYIPEGRREYRNIKMAVVGVLYLSDKRYKIEFLEKYAPVSPKIDHKNISRQVLQVQKAICRLAYHSRPLLPLPSIHKYIAGDYIHFCLPMFNNYLANMPSTRNFIETVLNAPLSIQKHGLRLAFVAYRPETLKPVIISAWKRTKNVSLRKVLYETLFYRILKENDDAQRELYEVLKTFTSVLNHDDHDDVFSLLVSDDLPNVFKGDFIEIAWTTVSKLPDKPVDIKRRTSIIRHMERYIDLVQRDFPRNQIIQDHVQTTLNVENLNRGRGINTTDLRKAKWELTTKYIVNFKNKEEQKQSLDLLQTIMSKCLESWSFAKGNIYTVRFFLFHFIRMIMNKDPKNKKLCAYMVPIYQCIHNNLKYNLQKEEIYLITLELKLSIKCRKIIHQLVNEVDSESNNPKCVSSSEIAYAFGKAVTAMVKKLVKDNEFHHYFYQSYADILNNRIKSHFSSITNMNECTFLYNVCDSLTDVAMKETHILALFMLPRDSSYYYKSEHAHTLRKLQEFQCEEVRSMLYEKYVMSDCSARKYILDKGLRVCLYI